MNVPSPLTVKVKHIHRFLRKSGILARMITTIILVIILGSVHIGGDHLVPVETRRIFATSSAIFSQFLPFSILLIIIGLVTPATASLGRGAGKWSSITAAIAYVSTLFSDPLTCLMCVSLPPRFPTFTQLADAAESSSALEPCSIVRMSASLQVMTALLPPFAMGSGLLMTPYGVLRKGFIEFRTIITHLIETIIIPLLPLHIFDIFLNLTYTGEAALVIRTLVCMVTVILVLEVIILSTQFYFTGLVACRDPFEALLMMAPVCLTALGTSLSAAAVPVTLRQMKENGVSDTVTSFAISLYVVVHLTGSISRIFLSAFAIVLTQGLMVSPLQWADLIFMLGITMVVAPGVSGGATMTTIGLLSPMLGFNDAQVALMIVTHTALDSFGTTTDVTGDGVIALVVDHTTHGLIGIEGNPGNTRELTFNGMAYPDRASIEGVVSSKELAESSTRNSSETVA